MIKLIVNIIHSKRDQSGNVYWSFTATDPATGKSVSGHISGGESNITASFRHLVGEDTNQVHYTVTQLGIREYDRTIKGWNYAGCHHQKIATFIKIGLGWSYAIDQYKVVAVEPDARSTEHRPQFVYFLQSNAFRPEERKLVRCGSANTYEIGKVFTVTDENFEEAGFDWVRQVKGNLFKIASVSSNPNSFGLYGHILIALNGEAWEVARAKGDWLDKWSIGRVIETSGDNWGALSCEIPHKLAAPPQNIIDEVWAIQPAT